MHEHSCGQGPGRRFFVFFLVLFLTPYPEHKQIEKGTMVLLSLRWEKVATSQQPNFFEHFVEHLVGR